MIPKIPSMRMKSREPLNRASTTAMIPRMLEALASCLVIDRIALGGIDMGKTCKICPCNLLYSVGLNEPRTYPRMAKMARAIGKIAISRLYARAADRFIDQSLLNLVIKACKGLVSF